MENDTLNSPKSFGNDKGKDTYFLAQKQRVFTAFLSNPKTMLMVSVETGILRANICRYIAELTEENRILIVWKSVCPITKHRAGFYTTNPELFPIVEPSNTQSDE